MPFLPPNQQRQSTEGQRPINGCVCENLVVDGGDVAAHGRDVGEGASALGAVVWSFAGVHRHVLLQVAKLCKRPAATVTRKRTNVLVQVGVHLHTTNIH